ncbi:dihydroorotase [Sphingomicrobium aestuariivivum]|uniref:dihydroorotase n=1 Tax=Sphingomicrobium aestuariivivum TaxID=1582356 RepID=UPI001FD703CA|nr:dihydroorotase [Sphingomicrobium aestuariivivum]MCJ8191413.1 dihydroorotase [Sphingomicrobium aestuariivivum]
MTETITIRRPDDWHLHLRDGAMMEAVLPYTARQFARAIVMPNLAPPVTTAAAAAAYRERILAALPEGMDFTPLMTAYLTDDTDPDDLAAGFEQGIWVAAKLYPAGATTNSASGVTDIRNIDRVVERMEKIGMPFLAHGEVTHDEVDIFDREARFIEEVAIPLLKRHEGLKFVFEHITTRDAAQFVEAGDARIAATVTPQHLQINRNAIFKGGINPHAYCLPVAKREEHRLAVRKAATGGSGKFFLGTDSAPHARSAKESACGCAGIFNAPFALEAYAEVFEEEGVLGRLEAFASLDGPRLYGMAPNEATVTLEKVETRVPGTIDGGTEPVVPYRAGGTMGWRLKA